MSMDGAVGVVTDGPDKPLEGSLEGLSCPRVSDATT